MAMEGAGTCPGSCVMGRCPIASLLGDRSPNERASRDGPGLDRGFERAGEHAPCRYPAELRGNRA
eukprot:1420383-Prorocentrum_lima.AAC.1